ncbi:MAG: hypothetical protein H7Y20_08425, partial [Bryobacteraceae bacterium]|nr:hypothetical protein [Bryobacteraceae bacterium]
MKLEPYLLDAIRREVVLTSLQPVCLHRDWTLLAAHVRTNPVHGVVAAHQGLCQACTKPKGSGPGRAQALGATREYATREYATREYATPVNDASPVG